MAEEEENAPEHEDAPAPVADAQDAIEHAIETVQEAAEAVADQAESLTGEASEDVREMVSQLAHEVAALKAKLGEVTTSAAVPADTAESAAEVVAPSSPEPVAMPEKRRGPHYLHRRA